MIVRTSAPSFSFILILNRYIGSIIRFPKSFAIFVMPFVTNRMIKQLGSNVGNFAQNLKVFTGPLHVKDHAPSLYA